MFDTLELPIWEGTYTQANQGEVKEFSLIFNKKINVIQQNNIPKIYYEKNDYSFITSAPGASEYANKLGDFYIKKIINFTNGRKLKNILEIGAGSDYIAKGIYKNNQYYLATLVDPTLRENLSNKIKIIRDYYPSDLIKNQEFDFIYSINTLEHVINPTEFLLQIRNNLTKDGWAAFIFPNIEEQFKRGDIGSLLHEHINYFDYKSARFLIEECGFNIIEGSTKNDEIFLLCERKKHFSKNTVQYDIKKIENLSIFFSQMLTKIKLQKEKISYFISNGQKVGFHGACNALSNFLYLSDLYKKNEFYIFDGDESKTNTYLPLSNNKILSTHDELYKDIDILFISASTFRKEIATYAKEFINSENIYNLFE